MRKIKLAKSILAALLALVLCLATGCGAATESESETSDVIGGDELSAVALTEVKAWSVGEKVAIGGYSWTAVAIEDDMTVLVCDQSVGTMAYNDAYEYAAWADCSLRTWLNGEFLTTVIKADQNFNSDLLVEAELATLDNSATWTGACTTTDTVYLLSEQDVKDYGTNLPSYASDCWLRTAGEQLTHAMVQKADGSLHITGYRTDYAVAGVRPCIRVSAKNSIAADYVALSSAQVGAKVAFGNYGGETLVWDVLAVKDGCALIMTDKVVDAVAFNATNDATVTYANSALASWLNGTFKSAAFSSEESAKIDTASAVVTPMNPTYATDGGADSTGIFVLSHQEYRMYCTTDSTKLAEATDTAVASGVSVDIQMGTAGYWLRTMGKDAEHVSYVKYYGDVAEDGVWQITTYLGVRPAMWVTIG